MNTLYVEGEGWYWEEDVLFGPYPKESDTLVEKMCLPGSYKYEALYAGHMPPRVGDFVKDNSGLFYGWVSAAGTLQAGNHKIFGYMVEAGDRREFIPADQIVWLSPVEWGDLVPDDMGDDEEN